MTEEIRFIRARMEVVAKVELDYAFEAFAKLPNADQYVRLENNMGAYQQIKLWPQSMEPFLLDLYKSHGVGTWTDKIAAYLRKELADLMSKRTS